MLITNREQMARALRGNFDDVMTVEGADGHEAASQSQYYESMQRQINRGQWSLQGSHGRAMMDAIKGGQCLLGKTGAHDYYGSYIPSRDEVQDGTKGSRSFVVEAMGEDWAAAMEAQP